MSPKITGSGPTQFTNLTIPETYVIRGSDDIRFGSADIGEGINTLILEGDLQVDTSSVRIRSESFSISSTANVSLANLKRLSSFNLDGAVGNIRIGAGSTFIVVPSNHDCSFVAKQL
ncbi:MAG: hypothetical protein AB8G18_09665 [Gammaproteobacteria bacterium]